MAEGGARGLQGMVAVGREERNQSGGERDELEQHPTEEQGQDDGCPVGPRGARQGKAGREGHT